MEGHTRGELGRFNGCFINDRCASGSGWLLLFFLVLITGPRISSCYYGSLLLLIALIYRDGITVGGSLGVGLLEFPFKFLYFILYICAVSINPLFKTFLQVITISL